MRDTMSDRSESELHVRKTRIRSPTGQAEISGKPGRLIIIITITIIIIHFL